METNSEDDDRIENDFKKNQTVCEYNDVDAYKVFINAWFFNFINSVLIFLYYISDFFISFFLLFCNN